MPALAPLISLIHQLPPVRLSPVGKTKFLSVDLKAVHHTRTLPARWQTDYLAYNIVYEAPGNIAVARRGDCPH